MSEHGEPLSEREIEILQMVATGVTNREVAYSLGISVNTVKVHLRNIFAKLGAESRTEATMIAVQEGWVSVATGEAPTPAEVQTPPPAPPLPPLPWFKRAALVTALLLVAAGAAATWPHAEPQTEDQSTDLPIDQQQAPPVAIPEEPVQSPWYERAQMPTRRAYLALAAVEGHIVAIAGRTPDGATGTVEVYDPQRDIWTRGNDKPLPVTHVSAAVLGTKVYVPGGCDANGAPARVLEVYDPQRDAWRQAAPLPQPRCAYALAAWNNKLYLFGGWGGERYVATTYVYDPQVDAWSQGTPMPSERSLAAAAVLGNRLYVVGGYDDAQELTACAAYAPGTETWEACPPMTVGRGGVGLVSLGDQLYAIGGGGWTSSLAFNERFNPTNNRWEYFETPVKGEWRSPGIAILDNTIYVVGGWNGDYLSRNLLYEPFPFRVFFPVSQK